MKAVRGVVLLVCIFGAALRPALSESEAADSLDLSVVVLDSGEVHRVEVVGFSDAMIDSVEDAIDRAESPALPEAVLTIVPAEGEAVVVVMRWEESTSTLAVEVDALQAPFLLTAIMSWPGRDVVAIPAEGMREFPTP